MPADQVPGVEGLKLTFGVEPEQYHRSRFHYPPGLVNAVASGVRTPPRILEVGCGSGHATGDFVGSAGEYLAIDISAELIAIAVRELGQNSNIRFVVGAFEEIPLHGDFDLLIAAQSFHWIDSGVGLRRANDLLAPGGRLAIFWNFVDFGALEFLRNAREVILGHVPAFEYWPDSSDERYHKYGDDWRRAVDDTKFFLPASVSSFVWSIAHSPMTFLDWVGTLSWFRILAPAEKQSLLAELRELGRGEGNTLDVPVRSLLISAEKVL